MSVDGDKLLPHLAPFGLSAFRPGQRDVIATVMAGHDCLCVMPTGGGKSLCYQLPAIAREGVTLVVSPLIALMKDQVDALTASGIPATFINSTLEPAELADRLQRMAAGEYRLMYVVPERFRSPRFLEAVRASRLNLLAVDEAHCISHWGHDFRPDYARLGRFRRQLGNPPTIALTATATDAVRRDIVELLELREPKIFITGFSRPNLFYEVQGPLSHKRKIEVLLDFLSSNPGAGIVYSTSRKRCEEVAEVIQQATGRPTGVYHAGLMPAERRAAQESFMRGDSQIVVATTAFGMGIDKADVRFVVHFNLPGSLEAYYQEAGRAGRDGQPSRCLLLYNSGDRFIHEFFIESAYPAADTVGRVYNFLRSLDHDPIELTQQQVKDQLNLSIGPEGVGTCEQLLEKVGALERLDRGQNLAGVRINSDAETLVDFLPQQARLKRRVLRAVEKLVGDRRRQVVYFHPAEILDALEIDQPSLVHTLRELSSLQAFEYLPAFRGRAIRMIERRKPLDQLGIDFQTLDDHRAQEFAKLDTVERFAGSRGCRQATILVYFGERDPARCGNCDNCGAYPRAKVAAEIVAKKEAPKAQVTVSQPAEPHPAVIEAVLKVLSGIARTQGRFGKGVVAQLLGGSKSAQLNKWKLTRLPTYGALSFLKQGEINLLIAAVMAVGYAEQVEKERFRPLLQLTNLGVEVMGMRTPLRAQLPLPDDLLEKLIANGPQSNPVGDKPGTPSAGPPLPATSPIASPSMDVADANRQLAEDRDIDEPFDWPAQLDAATVADEPTVSAASIGDPSTPSSRPSHYWTWRLLSSGFTPDECAAARGLPPATIVDHALRAANDGLAVEAGWFFSTKQLRKLSDVIGPAPTDRIRPLLARLPSFRYEEVQLFLLCRERAGNTANDGNSGNLSARHPSRSTASSK